jgi:hypothetical protein
MFVVVNFFRPVKAVRILMEGGSMTTKKIQRRLTVRILGAMLGAVLAATMATGCTAAFCAEHPHTCHFIKLPR